MSNELLDFAMQELGVIEGDLTTLGLVELAQQTASLKYEIEKEYLKRRMI